MTNESYIDVQPEIVNTVFKTIPSSLQLNIDGIFVGSRDGARDGLLVCREDGESEGPEVGPKVGEEVGFAVGSDVGLSVTHTPHK